MPIIGDELKGKEIGYENTSTARTMFVWVQCVGCEVERWARKNWTNPTNNKHRLCSPCAIKQAKTFRLNPEKAAIDGRI